MTDYSDEYLNWDNTEAVTVTVPRASSDFGPAVIDVAVARRGNVDRSAQFFNGVRLAGNEMLWLIPSVLLDGVDLGPDTVVTEETGTRWLVATAVHVRLGNSRGHWECLCREARA